MIKQIASVAIASLIALQAGAALADSRTYIIGQDGVYVSGSRGGFDRDRGDRWRDDRDHDWRGHRPPPPPPRGMNRNDDYAAGIMGFLGGMAVGSALDNGGRIPVIRQPPDRFQPRPVTLRPWSPGWYRWCDARYRSFDPRSGTYIDRTGRQRFCEVN
ncbi:BA14K family protein [Rhizobium sp. BK176]|uniref:BA14K family protein n=1 Tax=Rhizobium sp. BK176 TaxID=2587071 RepID=UPI00216A63F0|nr:BA14K family protein [Rhizobium sp. BK176]MCS4089031.1 hypothetical protein [Rhizobium sp. BK176]